MCSCILVLGVFVCFLLLWFLVLFVCLLSFGGGNGGVRGGGGVLYAVRWYHSK